MPHYLTNVKLSEKKHFDYALLKTGVDAEFHDHPMPNDYTDYYMDYAVYSPELLVGTHGSVYANDSLNKDYSEFWRFWRESEDNSKQGLHD